MKNNHTSRKVRIEERILSLKNKIDGIWEPYGDGNPYNYCKHCRQSQPYVSFQGHHKGCDVLVIEAEIQGWERLLNQEETSPSSEST